MFVPWAIRSDINHSYPGAHTSQKNVTFGPPVGDNYSNPGGGTDDPGGDLPGVPLDPVIDLYTDDTITISWVEPVDKGSDPASLVYPVEYKVDDGNHATGFSLYQEVTDPSVQVSGLTEDTPYVFRFASRTSVGQSDYTSVLIQATLPQFPNINQSVILEPYNESSEVFNTYQNILSGPDDSYIPATNDGDPVATWGFNGGSIAGFQSGHADPVIPTLVLNPSVGVPYAVQFINGAKLKGHLLPPTDGFNGWEVIIVMRRFSPQPPVDRQTTGLWWTTSEPTPPTTDSTDSHYPDDNGVIYERFGSDVRRSIFPVPIDVTQWHIYQIRAREGEYKVWINNHLVIDSTSNVLANAPLVDEQILGASKFWPDEASYYNGYFQVATAVFHVPDEEEDAVYRESVTTQLRNFYQEKFNISNQSP